MEVGDRADVRFVLHTAQSEFHRGDDAIPHVNADCSAPWVRDHRRVSVPFPNHAAVSRPTPRGDSCVKGGAARGFLLGALAVASLSSGIALGRFWPGPVLRACFWVGLETAAAFVYYGLLIES